MKLLPDTNVLIYDTIEDSENHDVALKIIDSADEIFIPPIVIHEYIWVLLRFNVEPKIISIKLREYLEDPRTKYLPEYIKDLSDALKMLEEDKASIKDINDYLIISLALNNKLTLATFDNKLKVAALKRKLNIIP